MLVLMFPNSVRDFLEKYNFWDFQGIFLETKGFQKAYKIFVECYALNDTHIL